MFKASDIQGKRLTFSIAGSQWDVITGLSYAIGGAQRAPLYIDCDIFYECAQWSENRLWQL